MLTFIDYFLCARGFPFIISFNSHGNCMRPILLLLPFLQEKEANVCHGHMSAFLPFVEEDIAT